MGVYFITDTLRIPGGSVIFSTDLILNIRDSGHSGSRRRVADAPRWRLRFPEDGLPSGCCSSRGPWIQRGARNQVRDVLNDIIATRKR
jgi:hypothetical protein